jgi:hypothetical protein
MTDVAARRRATYALLGIMGLLEGGFLHAAFHAASSSLTAAALILLAFGVQVAVMWRYVRLPLGYVIFVAVAVVDAFLLHLGDHLAASPQTRSLTAFALFGLGVVSLAGLVVWLALTPDSSSTRQRKGRGRA